MADVPEDQGSETSRSSAQRLYVSIDSLLLDPNNFRFRDHADYKPVPEDRIADEDVQRRTTGFVLGRNQSSVGDLLDSITVNGWLEVDPILVRKLGRGQYLVVEGNRRVATLKYLKRRYDEDAIDLGKLDPALFGRVPVVQYTDADPTHHYVMMGLHHISGKKRWPAINRARLMKLLLDEHGLDSDAVCKSLGVSKREFNLSVRTLALCEQYRSSDFGDQFESETFNLFREVLKAPAIRTWIGWDNETQTARNSANLERLFSWMSHETASDDDDDDETSGAAGQVPPVITTGGHVREFAKLVDDEQAIKRLEQTRSLQEATLSSDLLVENEIDEAFARAEREIDKLSQRAMQLSAEHLDRIDVLQGKLEGISVGRKRRPLHVGLERQWSAFNDLPAHRFSELRIDHYRGLHGLRLEDLRRRPPWPPLAVPRGLVQPVLPERRAGARAQQRVERERRHQGHDHRVHP